ncbi:MAG: hypothetical protein RI988_1956 [Pseudomonadota bacterium]
MSAHEPGRDAGDARASMSALADGELLAGPPGDARALEAALSQWSTDASAREAWSTYHTIGDVMRSEDLAAHAGGDEAFLQALRARLAAEPTVLAPGPLGREGADTGDASSARRRAHWRVPAWLGASAAVAGVAAVAVVTWVVQVQEVEPAGLAVANGPHVVAPWRSGGGMGAVQPVAVQAPRSVAHGAGVLEDYLRVHQGALREPVPAQVPVRLEAEGWTLSRVPEGFELHGAVRRLADHAAPAGPGAPPAQQVQAVYRQGAQRVSVFIDPAEPGQPREPLALRAGAITVLMVPHGQDAFVTVMGEVSLPTLQQFAGALRRHP